MLTTLAIVVFVFALWAASAFVLGRLRRITFHQAFFLLPVKLVHRIDDRSLPVRPTQPPVLYAVLHQSQLDPALMLSLLPDETLHMLDERSARSPWLEPWREMARTIAFNPRHVFVSRRLVRHLKGRGRLAVYFPAGVTPETRAYRLYRAVAKIAAAADAKIVAVAVQGADATPFALLPASRRSVFAKLRVKALEPLTVTELVALSGRETATMAGALFDRVAEANTAD